MALDLTHLLYVNLTPEVRQQGKTGLLNKYLEDLNKFIRAKGVELGDILTEKWLEEEMAAFSVYGLVYSIWMMPVFYMKDEHFEKIDINAKISADELGEEYVRRVQDTVLECLS